ncbi:MAG: dihydropteroate synthase [Candidatus Omnitrophota bacterium]
MGILNLTPDSFSGDGFLTKNYSPALGLELAQKLIQDGADIIDVGGESTRPSARFISAKEEIRRIIPTIKLLTKKIKKPISVDTYKEPVAKAALDCGAAIVNNIKGTSLDKSLIKTIKSYRAAIVLMHIRGNPKTMQKNIRYQNVIAEIISELKESIEKCLEFGLSSDKIIVDPGIGFGKTVDQNFEIIRRLSEFKTLGFPILVGTSRKSFIGKALNKEAHQRLWGTAASVAAAILNGAHIVRVHDVKEMRDVVKVTDAILNAKNKN